MSNETALARKGMLSSDDASRVRRTTPVTVRCQPPSPFTRAARPPLRMRERREGRGGRGGRGGSAPRLGSPAGGRPRDDAAAAHPGRSRGRLLCPPPSPLLLPPPLSPA